MGELRATLIQVLSGSMTQVLNFAPRLLSALLLLLIGLVVSGLIAAFLRRVLTRLKFESIMQRSGLVEAFAEAGFTIDATTLLSRLVYWLILLSFLLTVIDILGLQSAAAAMRTLLAYFPNLIGAILVLIGGAFMARFAGQFVQAVATRAGLDMASGLGVFVRSFLLILAFVLAAGQLGLKVDFIGDALLELVIVLVAVIGLILALGGRDIVQNILAGFYVREMYTLGSQLEIANYQGTLEAIDTLKATLHTEQGQVSIPNTLLLNEITRSSGPSAD